jgi:hypothetical protein
VRFGEYYRFDLERPANGGVLGMGPVSSCAGVEFLERKHSKISSQFQENSRFMETRFGDWVRSPLDGRVVSAKTKSIQEGHFDFVQAKL